ncbi:MAG: chemotaxis protein CheW [Deltaproteobacteria bacterium]|nr:chemotaxis protein CheW [Deltaproteobacteria bacterium]
MSHSLLVIRVQTFEVAIEAGLVREIVGARTWVPVPGARVELPGVVAWGGRAVAMLDIARVVPGLRPLAPGEQRPRALIVDVHDSVLAVPSDWVSEVRVVADDKLGPRAVHEFALARAEVDFGDAVVPLLDPRLLLDRSGDDAAGA